MKVDTAVPPETPVSAQGGKFGLSSHWAAGVAGLVGGGLALGTSEFMSAVAQGVASLVGSVGQAVIDWSPGSLVHLGIRLLGHHDKAFVVVMVVIMASLAATALGVAASRRRWIAGAGFCAFGAIGVLCAVRDPQARPVAVVVTTALSVAVGVATTDVLLRLAPRPAGGVPASPNRGWPSRQPPPTASRYQPLSRRTFLSVAAAAAGLAVAAGASGRRRVQQLAAAGRRRVVLPPVADPVPPPTPADSVAVRGISPIVVPNNSFYRIDTRLLGPPSVNVDTWRLRITGKVDHPQELTWDELTAFPMMETYLTLQCVSNEVGGNLVGNASWRGVRLSDLLNRAGVHADADQIVGRSVDGFTVGFPTTAAFDGRHALVAVGMNDELLPVVHGFPARLIVAGLYGYVSATKWLAEIQLTRFDAYDSYWVTRGWDRQGVIKTESRIDTIAPNPPAAGPSVLAGVAWAPTRGISKVEVQVDSGPWRAARLAAALSRDTWRQWSFPWTATPGRHVIKVRATDGDGQTQTAVNAEPLPSAATGYHTVTVDIPT
jgi:DMSO/TMAO reductase YedYZ molybdopterin-dependent catalytic subunit